MNITTRIVAILFLLFVLSPGLGLVSSAYADGELQVNVREVKVNQNGTVQLLAKVVDRNGRPLPSLTRSSFSMTSGSTVIPIADVQTASDAQVGISALLVVDTSGSMVGTPLAAARNAAAQYVRSLEPVDEVSVVAFANGVQVISEFSRDFPAVEASLGGLRAFGDTALFGAVGDAADRMTQRPAARRVVIFLSDGADFGISAIGREESIAAATGSGVPFYVIGLGPAIDADYLQQLADATGGAYFPAPSSDQLDSLFDEIALLLRSEYVLTADFAGTGLAGATTATLRAEAAPGNGQTLINLALPAVPVAPNPDATQDTRIPEPVQVPELAPEGSSAGLILVLLVVGALGAAGVWYYMKKRRARPKETYVFGPAPVYTREDHDQPAPAREAPKASLRLESGEAVEIDGVATLGLDRECTYQLPLSRSEFGAGVLRVWFANQRYLIRDEAPRPRFRVNGRPVTFSLLGDGDEIDVKGVKLRFVLSPAIAPVPAQD